MGPLRAGEPCLLVDDRGRKFLLDLQAGQRFSTHQGQIDHDVLIGAEEGSTFETNRGAPYVALRPTLEDFVLTMKRGAQIVYPKDTGAILVHGDIAPGHTVLEAGTGSGALTLALARAVGPGGRLVSAERREDHHGRAARTVERFFGGSVPDHVELVVGEVEDLVGEVVPDRLVLDLPEPWSALEAGAAVMAGGAVAVAYVPTVPQLEKTVREMDRCWTDVVAREVLVREWHVGGRSVRPDHRMVGHTGFIISGRVAARAQGST